MNLRIQCCTIAVTLHYREKRVCVCMSVLMCGLEHTPDLGSGLIQFFSNSINDGEYWDY